MQRHIAFPEIGQFNNTCKNVSDLTSYDGKDADGNVIRNYSRLKPTITFTGTVKLHGTNAGVSYNSVDGIWYQSRSNIITPLKDNAGFAFFAESNKEFFIKAISKLAEENNVDLSEFNITVYGEWAGGSIQKGVGINGMPKRFFVFGAKVSQINPTEDFNNYWIHYATIEDNENEIYNITQFPTWAIDVDFENAALSQPVLSDLTMKVEEECPVAKFFGVSGVGEGIVWTANYLGNDLRFKVKGEKHSSSKVKVLAPVDIEKLNSVNEFVEYALTKSRFDQAIQSVFGIEQEADIKRFGEVLKWLMGDIIKEETDAMKNSGIEPKDITGGVAKIARTWFGEIGLN
jgi:hypothetical protein